MCFNEIAGILISVGEFSTLITEINFKRPKGSYGITVIAPPIIVVIIALMSFFLDKNVTTRITIPTGGLTQLFVQWAGIYNMLSLDSTPDYLDIWMLGNIICVGLILVFNIIICHYKYIQVIYLYNKYEKCIFNCISFLLPKVFTIYIMEKCYYLNTYSA